jgi:hypothetical protein
MGADRPFRSIFRETRTLQNLMQLAMEKTDVRPRSSDTIKNGVPLKVAAVFTEPQGDCDLHMQLPKKIDERVEIISALEGKPSTLVALYNRPQKDGNFGHVAMAMTKFCAKAGIKVTSTARALSVVDDIVAGRLRP